MKSINTKKKAVVSLDIVEAVIFSLLVIGVLSITLILVLSSLIPAADTITKQTITYANETIRPLDTGVTLAGNSYYNSVCSIVRVVNTTSSLIPASNYTVTNCIIANKTSEFSGNALWNVTYSTTYSSSATFGIAGNVSNANVSFFSNSGTFFSILAVVVIIALIALIVLYIRQFRTQGGVTA